MDFFQQYLARAQEITGERTPDEIKYDNEVIRWLRRGKSIKKAIAKANEKYPSEALSPTEDTLPDIQSHYDYLATHYEIMGKLKIMQEANGPM